MKRKLNQTDWLILLYSFTVPALALLVSFALKGLAPFGTRSIFSMDGFSQYYPMLMNMKEALKNGEPFYSYSGALGFNLWAQNAYYTNSPLWIILYLLPHSVVGSAADLSVVFKTALAGLFFALRIIKKTKSENDKKKFFTFTFLSVCYALSAYMLAFINQLMWTDVIVLLPLVIFGIEELFEKRKPTLYIISLFLSIFSCFYISYMVCIFACLYFLYLSFKDKISIKEIIPKGINFALSSFCAGGMAAIVLVPVFKALSLTMASDMGFTGNLELRYTISEFLVKFLPFSEPSLEFGAPNLYCSIFAVLLMIGFFFIKKVPLRERLVTLAFVTFMCLSMCINLGEYIWHGFHFPNQLPARQSFLLIFLILSVAAKFAENFEVKEKNAKYYYVACTAVVFVVCLSYISTFSLYTWTSRLDSLQKYEASIDKIKEEIDEDGFYRMAWTDEKKNNSPQQHGYNGICYYSSTMTADAYNFFQNLGMEKYAKNVSTHYTGSYITHDLFGIKYVITEKTKFENEDERFNIKKNENALPLGYLSENDVVNIELSNYEKGLEAQKALFESITPDDINGYENRIAYLKDNGFEISEFDTDYIRGKIKAEKNGTLLFTIPYDEGWKIIVDGEEVEPEKAAEYLLCCEISKGEHEVELEYTVPGIKIGGLISAISFMGCVCLIALSRKKREE